MEVSKDVIIATIRSNWAFLRTLAIRSNDADILAELERGNKEFYGKLFPKVTKTQPKKEFVTKTVAITK